MKVPRSTTGLVEISPELERWIQDQTWWIYVCAEPDGQHCASGTHPNILRHECAALDRWHKAMDARKSPDDPVDETGPVVVRFPVKYDPELMPEEWR
jgi:hypothetical protein